APWVEANPARPWSGPGPQFDTSIGWRFTNPALAARDKATYSMPETAEEVARTDGISRAEADGFAYESHQRALGAIAAGHFDDEILPITVDLGRRGTRTVTADEGPRPDTSLAALAELRPVVTGGSVVTAGNSSSLNDGSSAPPRLPRRRREIPVEPPGTDRHRHRGRPRSGGDGARPGTRNGKGSRASGPRDRGHRRDRTQRSFRDPGPRRHPAPAVGPPAGEHRWRRDRPRPPARLLRLPPPRHPARSHGAGGCPVWTRDDV